MLTINVPNTELFIEKTGEFISFKAQTLHLEHSLISISKWESKWQKPFLTKENKSEEEIRYYVKCMTVNTVTDPNVYLALTTTQLNAVADYIQDKMTATWFNEREKGKANHEIITSELIYYWMIAAEIPFECQKWHLNRLLTLIKICSIKNEEATSKNKNKMPRSSALSQQRALNAARRQAAGSRG